MIYGTEEDSYAALPKYLEDLKRNNPDSVIELECIEEGPGIHRFRRAFICYGASAKGFAFCCPVLGLDGTHLKGKYKGMPIPI